MTKNTTTDNQITWTTEKRKVKDLVPYDRNPRRLGKKEYQDLKNSIEKYNIAEIPAINTDNMIIAGHQRCGVLLKLGRGEEFIDVRVPSRQLTENEFREYLIRSNKNSGEWDWDALANNFDKDELIDWGFSKEELLGDLEIEEIDSTEGDDEVPAAAPAITVKGDLYQLGEHFLLCGDSIDNGDVEKLMRGERAEIIITDPPWNVNYGADDNDGHYRKRTIMNDKQKAPDWALFCDELAGNLFLSSRPGAMIYLVMSAQEWPAIDLALRENGFHWSSTIIWAKDRLVLSRKDYHTRYEPIWYGWNGEAPRLFPLKDRKQDDVWEIERPSVSELHPTTKPISLIEKMLRNSSKPGSIVIDFFGGSGSTLIAAEKCGRKCYMMELDEKYADVIVQRYVDFCVKNSRKWSVIRNKKDISKDYGATAPRSKDKKKITNGRKS